MGVMLGCIQVEVVLLSPPEVLVLLVLEVGLILWVEVLYVVVLLFTLSPLGFLLLLLLV